MWSMPSRRLVLSLTRHLSHDKFMWHLGVGQHVTALFKYQGCYIDTATFLNFMSCRKRSNKNICMYIKGSASSKILYPAYIFQLSLKIFIQLDLNQTELQVQICPVVKQWRSVEVSGSCFVTSVQPHRAANTEFSPFLWLMCLLILGWNECFLQFSQKR